MTGIPDESQSHFPGLTDQGPLDLQGDIEEIIRSLTDGGGGSGVAAAEIVRYLQDAEATKHHPAVLAEVIAEAIRNLTENLHIHRWDIIDVYRPPARQSFHPLIPAPVPVTYVLLRCREDNTLESHALAGEWTLAQLKANIKEGEDGRE